MKKITLTLIISLFSLSSLAMDLTFKPGIAGGFRSGKESLNDNPVAYAGVKFHLLSHEIDGGFKSLNFLGAGLNYQSDNKFSFSVSPISVSTFTGMTIGLDLFIKEKDVKGGNVGLFIGYTF